MDKEIYLVNKICKETLGYNSNELTRHDISSLLHAENYDKIISSFKDKSINQTNNIIRNKIKRKDGEYLTIEWNASMYQGYVFLVGRNITDLIESQKKILYLSYHDKLTGIYNRSFFEEELKRLDNDRNLPLSIVMGDVDGLKITNDVFGHFRGDKPLKDISEILKISIRKGDILSRWGGDEFIILLPNTGEDVTKEIINRIYKNTKKLESTLDYASISLGYSIKTSPEQDVSDILINAENYMYKIKARRGQTFRKKLLPDFFSLFIMKSMKINLVLTE